MAQQDTTDENIKYEEEFITRRGLKLFTCRWLPVNQDVKALLFLCHGYGMETSIFMKDTGIRFAQAGYAVFGMDVEGHGKSDGLQAYIPSFNDIVDDCIAYFKSIRGLQNDLLVQHPRKVQPKCDPKDTRNPWRKFKVQTGLRTVPSKTVPYYVGIGLCTDPMRPVPQDARLSLGPHWTEQTCAEFNAELEEYKNKARFLYGESMGGAVVLHIHRKEPQEWNGAILQAPMCKIADDMKPHPLVVAILIKLTNFIPTWKIVPSKDIINNAFKDPLKREQIRMNPYAYQGKPRAKTALELLNASKALEQRLDQVTFPFLLLHGEADRVTEPEISRELYMSAKSVDKEFKLYPGMWHGLTAGEPDENIELVFSDIIHWLNARSPAGSVRGSPLRHADVSAVVANSSATASKHEPDLESEFKLDEKDHQKLASTSTT